ncbi:MAG: RNA methyltransferase [Syntrophobacterales bacterium]|nr:RNA methyltransferase [Syntrophobacterales bacterium]
MTVGVRKENITIVLNKPKYPGNIGSVARCAKNMGIENVIVVGSPPADREKILQLATHGAADVVDGVRRFDDLGEALSGFNYVVGTTSRLGRARRPSLHPRELAAELVDLSQNNEVALLFGPEDFGLTNDEIRYCHALVTIPTAEAMKSINLSHAVMILCYEIFLAGWGDREIFTPKLATVRELEGMYGQIQALLTRVDFISPGDADHRMMNIRRFLSRVKLYSREVRVIRGVCRQLDWYYGRNKKT